MRRSKNSSRFWVPAAAAVLGVAAVLAYVLTFGETKASTSREVWAWFGDYIGGVLAAGFTFATVILLVQQLQEQQQATRDARLEAVRARRQSSRLARESTRVQSEALLRAERSASAAEALVKNHGEQAHAASLLRLIEIWQARIDAIGDRSLGPVRVPGVQDVVAGEKREIKVRDAFSMHLRFKGKPFDVLIHAFLTVQPFALIDIAGKLSYLDALARSIRDEPTSARALDLIRHANIEFLLFLQTLSAGDSSADGLLPPQENIDQLLKRYKVKPHAD